jgi:NAD(P)H-dependent flavin oxidoreductase YrpB (nitropropane dioxygenase family)
VISSGRSPGKEDIMTIDGSTHLLELLDIQWPVIQAPMAGVGTPSLAAAVSNAGGLGSLGVGATNAEGAKKMIAAFRALSARSLNVNVFCHQPAKPDARLESAWIERLRPEFARFGATPPTRLTEIYRSFVEDDDMLAALHRRNPRSSASTSASRRPSEFGRCATPGSSCSPQLRIPKRRKLSLMPASTR